MEPKNFLELLKQSNNNLGVAPEVIPTSTKPHLYHVNRGAFDQIWKQFSGKIPNQELWNMLYLNDDTANFVAEKKHGGEYIGSWGQNPHEITPPYLYKIIPETKIREFIPNWNVTSDAIEIPQEDIYSRLERMKNPRMI